VDTVGCCGVGQEMTVEKLDEFKPLTIGSLSVWPPVVLAPMAGVTNYPFRTLCRRFGAGLYISEMVTARSLVNENPKALKLIEFGPEETTRSLQLYGVDPDIIGTAVERLIGEALVDHIDLNFGCPVRKVTRKGGGAALPLKPNLLQAIVRSAVEKAGKVPVTIKFRIGIDDAHHTFIESGRIAQEEGCAAVSLHARTAEQLYSGRARWETIADLKRVVTRIPVLGNGDIWEAEDALSMMRMTSCDGVVVGRGCLGRPWLFRDLVDVFQGNQPQEFPRLGQVIDVMLEHACMLSDWLGEDAAMRAFRRHSTWYTKGFRDSAQLRRKLMQVATLSELQDATADIDRQERFPDKIVGLSRGKTSKIQKVTLPEGYL
jgi:nifR3 family TIM-barrel protein